MTRKQDPPNQAVRIGPVAFNSSPCVSEASARGLILPFLPGGGLAERGMARFPLHVVQPEHMKAGRGGRRVLVGVLSIESGGQREG